jgi:SAM-dependent methyltransferase
VHQERQRAESFGAAAERYDRTRPTYPSELFDEILGPAPAGLDVLDVGTGTGIAARLMAGRGAHVLGVEADGRMAEVARERGVPVEVARFEEWEPAGRTFDRITAAQAWHWVDPVQGPVKAAALLRPAGRLCLFWNIGEPPADVRRAFDQVYEKLAPTAHAVSVMTGYSAATRYEAEREGVRMCPGLTDPVEMRFPWPRAYTRDQWLDQLPTHSDHAVMDPDQLARVLDAIGDVIDDFGGEFVMDYTTYLIASTRHRPGPHRRRRPRHGLAGPAT